MTEYKYVAQDKDWFVFRYEHAPARNAVEWFDPDLIEAEETRRDVYKPIKSWKKRCFDLSKFDYEIIEGKLIGIPKAAPEWMMILKDIDIKAFDWITRRKNIDDICKAESLMDGPFVLSKTKQGAEYWDNLHGQIEAYQAAQKEQPKRHPHADLMHLFAEDCSIKVEYFSDYDNCWKDVIEPSWFPEKLYRIKPQEVEGDV